MLYNYYDNTTIAFKKINTLIKVTIVRVKVFNSRGDFIVNLLESYGGELETIQPFKQKYFFLDHYSNV